MKIRKEVLRVEDTIRRQWRAWSPAVASLLRLLESSGFAGAPRSRGRDDEGREVVEYIEGDVPHYPLDAGYWSDAALLAAARLLRRFHDATVSIVGAALPWRFDYAGSQEIEVICHNDIAPYNTVYDQSLPKAFIDFDTAGPGPRVWDVCYAAYRFVPLIPAEDYARHGVPANLDVAPRLNQFCRAYGEFDGDLVEELLLRLEVLWHHIEGEAEKGIPWHVDNVARGDVRLYQRHAQWIRTQRNLFTSALSGAERFAASRFGPLTSPSEL